MAKARICDKCHKVLRYAPDTRIKIYVHPYGDMEYELCHECTEKLKVWLQNEKQYGVEEEV